MRSRCARVFGLLPVAATMVVASPSEGFAQLDPLLFLKATRPNVLLLVDTSWRMLLDEHGDYFDPHAYEGNTPADLVLNPAGGPYRRQYRQLRFAPEGQEGFTASGILGVGAASPEHAGFHNRSRIGVAKLAIARALRDTPRSARFGLLSMRQRTPVLPDAPNAGPVTSSEPNQQGTGDRADGQWSLTRPVVDAENRSLGERLPLVAADESGANERVRAIAERPWSDLQWGPALLPAGHESATVVDAPLAALLEDARTEALRLIAADTECRNTVGVLIAGGGEGSGRSADEAPTIAATFRALAGRRVPVYVLAIMPDAEARRQLQAIAAAGGGRYFEVDAAALETTAATGYLEAVPVAVRAIDTAVQHAFAWPADVDTEPTTMLPSGRPSEFQTTGPVVGTVNLQGAAYLSGERIDDHDLQTATGSSVAQRANVMVSAGFALPGFEARLRAFRVYRPEIDPVRQSGYRFVADGRALWVARTPAPSARNIYTVLPGGAMVAFSAANEAVLSPYLHTFDAGGLIEFIRGQPVGAIVSSTPAVLEPPSADWPPDTEFTRFAADHQGRRTLVFVGANDGMLHAFDARSGLEVWAVIPFNLLPKLKALRDGQGLDRFDYFVDGSPRLADVRVDHDGDGRPEWRTYLYVGQGAGGTFYQAFDVTLDGAPAAGLGATVSEDVALAYFAEPSRIRFAWAFPRYSAFDVRLGDERAGVFGDVSTALPHGATDLELSVGQAWSTPAVGAIGGARGGYGVLTGSGFFPWSREQVAWRRDGAVRVGTTFYLLDAGTGNVLGAEQVPADALGERADDCVLAGGCAHLRNALQADAAAVGPPGGGGVTAAYAGDLDGNVWRFDLGVDAAGLPGIRAVARVFSAGPGHPIFGGIAAVAIDGQRSLFFGSGSDQLPPTGASSGHRLFGVVDGAVGTRFVVELQPPGEGQRGERVTGSPALAGDVVFFATMRGRDAGGCIRPDAHLYALTFTGGAAYDSNGDEQVSIGESPRVETLTGAGKVTAPFVADRHVVFGAGERLSVLGDPEEFNQASAVSGVRVLSWRRVK
jgi:outer membrane protein assembly factor BamB